MAKFNTKGAGPAPRVKSPVTTTGAARTALGGHGFSRTPESDLYLLSVSNMVSEKTFHEDGDPRDERYVDLLHTVALDHPEFGITEMLPWLRHEGFMRTASVLGAAEAARVLCDAHRYSGVTDMVDGVLGRADELGEFLAYWFSIAGKAWPKRYLPVKEGLKRATSRLITEYSYGKYDSAKWNIRFADIIAIVHPVPVDAGQSDLFKMILDRHHNRLDSSTVRLPMFTKASEWHTLASANPKATALLDPSFVKAAGLTWEDMMSALGSHVRKSKIWEAVIPNMGVGALLKNLRNFDEAEISEKTAAYVCGVISDPERVQKAKVFPYRFLAAHRAVPSLRWGHALETGLRGSLERVPALGGHTLVLVDRSPSMFPGKHYSTPSQGDISLADQAAVFGAAIAQRAGRATLVEFGGDTGGYRRTGIGSRAVEVRKGASVLKIVDSFGPEIPGTDIPRAIKDNLTGTHDRVVIVTDEQSRPGYVTSNMSGVVVEYSINNLIPKTTPVYVWNMAGYKASVLNSGGPNRHSFGGLSDASFGLIDLLERRRNAHWPWKK